MPGPGPQPSGTSGATTVVASGALTSTALVTGGGTTMLQTPSANTTLLANGNLSLVGTVVQTPAARASGVAPYFTINIPTDTGQTAATESIGFRTVTGTRTWATTGTVALQRENYFAAPTYASAGASQTFTDVFNLYVDKPIVGANAIFTRPHTLGVIDATAATSSITGGLIVATTLGTVATSVGIGGGNIHAGGTLNVQGITTIGATGSTDGGIFNINKASGAGIFLVDTSANTTTLATANRLQWSTDVNITRQGAGILQIGTTTANALGSLLFTALTASGATQTWSNAAFANCTALTTVSNVMGCTASDETLKAGFTLFSRGLDFIRNVTPQTFQFKEGNRWYDGGRTRLGLLAQEVQRLLPEAVFPIGPEQPLQIDYNAVVAALVDVVKQQDRQITALNLRLGTLWETVNA